MINDPLTPWSVAYNAAISDAIRSVEGSFTTLANHANLLSEQYDVAYDYLLNAIEYLKLLKYGDIQ